MITSLFQEKICLTEKLSHRKEILSLPKFPLEIVKNNILSAQQTIKKSCEISGRNYEDVTLLAATKTVDTNTINFAIQNGIKCIGENRVQELLEKYDYIDKSNVDIHFIGTLQTNKVKYIVDKVSLIHSVDSLKLAQEIDKQSKKRDIVSNILVEINIGNEESKSGISEYDALTFIENLSKLENLKVKGLMCIPPIIINEPFVNNKATNCNDACSEEVNVKKIYKNRAFFEKMMKLFLDISAKKIDNIYMQDVSMGMSEDFDVAVEQGATIVRLGRVLFGSR